MASKNTMPHLGGLINAKIQEKHLTRDAVGKSIGKKGITVYGYTLESSVQARILWEMSKALDFDFFEHLSKCLHNGASATDKFNNAQEQIAQLQSRITDLEKEVAIYKAIVLKK